MNSTSHTLAEFVYGVFGVRFGELLMVGYNEEPSREKKIFYLSGKEVGETEDWMIEVIANSLPCRQEPLVLAALLKLLMEKPVLSSRLEFEVSEIVEKLGWSINPETHQETDQIISKYVSVVYDKQQALKGKQDRGEDAAWGIYSFLTSYIRVSNVGASRSPAQRAYRYVDFNRRFVEGLKSGQVYFADIRFGLLNSLDDIVLPS